MHKFVLKFFSGLESFWHFVKILSVFFIMIIQLYWIQDLTNGSWAWMNFFAPFVEWLLKIGDSIYSASFDLFGAVFELKYLNACILVIIFYFFINVCIKITHIIEDTYSDTRAVCKKTEEKIMNNSFKKQIQKQEAKISKYVITIHTRVKQNNTIVSVDLNKQNELMIQFIKEKLGIVPQMFEDGFMYAFQDINKIDNILEILFKVLRSKMPIEYAICVQVGEISSKINQEQLKYLINLKHYGKIIMAADTLFRYNFNIVKNYQTSQLGVFQCENKILEVHEFKQY